MNEIGVWILLIQGVTTGICIAHAQLAQDYDVCHLPPYLVHCAQYNRAGQHIVTELHHED